jgi:phosphoribosylaminoimidazole-succinocarboxamide synthase
MDQTDMKLTRLGDINFYKRGKVRDIYDFGEQLLMVSTDRISCFDVVLPTVIPQKGAVLTRLSEFWFDLTDDIIDNHFITSDVDEFPESLLKYREDLNARSMLVKKTKPVPVECIVRGYLSGSGWREYQKDQTICGLKLPAGLRESDKLPEPIFTPSTKAETGHDINVSQEYIENAFGKELTDKLKEKSLALYKKAGEYALERGIIIADTKFEFGWYDEELILIDEVLTPDSSRFWPKDEYSPGRGQPSFDKQYVRDYLKTVDWDKTYPGPELPQEIISKTTEKYLQALRMLTGKGL